MSLTIECQGSWPLVILAWVVSAGTVVLALALTGHAKWRVWRTRRQAAAARRELTRVANGHGHGHAHGRGSVADTSSVSLPAGGGSEGSCSGWLGLAGRLKRSRKGRHPRGRGPLRAHAGAGADCEEAAESLIDLSSMAERSGQGQEAGTLALDVEEEDGDDEAEAIDEGLEEVEETLQALDRSEEEGRQPKEEEDSAEERDRKVTLDVRTLDATGTGMEGGGGEDAGAGLEDLLPAFIPVSEGGWPRVENPY